MLAVCLHLQPDKTAGGALRADGPGGSCTRFYTIYIVRQLGKFWSERFGNRRAQKFSVPLVYRVWPIFFFRRHQDVALMKLLDV